MDRTKTQKIVFNSINEIDITQFYEKIELFSELREETGRNILIT